MGFINVFFDKKKKIAKNTYSFIFRLKEKNKFIFKPGQYIWLILPNLKFSDLRGNRRAFSIISTPNKDSIEVLMRQSKSGYKRTCFHLLSGDKAKIEGPFGSSYVPVKDFKNIVFIAGGIGIAPFLSILRTKNKTGKKLNITLIYVNSSTAERAFFDELQSICERQNIQFIDHLGSFGSDILPEGIDYFKDSFYICGSKDFVNTVSKVLQAKGAFIDNMKFEQNYPTPLTNLTEAELNQFTSKKTNIGLRAIEQSNDHIVLTDINGQILYANKAAEDITGYSKNEMIGNTPRLWGGNMSVKFYKNLWSELKKGEPYVGEITNRRKNGEKYNAIARISPMKNSQNETIAFIATEEDITSKINIINELKIAKSKNKAIIDEIGEGLIITDQRGIISFINKAAEELLGYRLKETVGKKMIEFLPKYDDKGVLVPENLRPLEKVLSGKAKKDSLSTILNTHYYVVKNNKKLYVTGIVTPLVIKKKVLGAIQIFRDFSKEKQLDKAKDEFLSVASHELRTPLTAIDGIVSMILDGEYGTLGDNLRQPLEDISKSSERLIHLVNDLLSLSRIQAGKLKYSITDFSLKLPINEIIEIMQPVMKQNGVKLEVESIIETEIQGDIDKVKQILMNLIGNAFKFTDKGKVTISTVEKHQSVEVYVEDTGIGIAKEDQFKLFGKFEQLGSSDGRAIGTGLGLHISRQMAQKMGGDVWLKQSDLGKGSTFAFSLPKSSSKIAYIVKNEIEKEFKENPDQKSDIINHGK